jgi:uncharacterized protein (TIGR00661 family)
MKILYGIQATGNGHISRSRVMARYLSEHGVDVTYLFSGRAKDKLFDMEIFGDYLHRRGLTFVIKNGRINQLQTVMQNNIFTFINDIRNIDLDEYDLILSDFEPVTAWAAKLKNKPSIGVGHQYAFGPGTPVAGRYSLGRAIMKAFAPVKYRAGLHWHPFGEGVLPPIIDFKLQRTVCDQGYIVYLPFENQSQVTEILNRLDGYQFVQYSPDLSDSQCGNVALRKTCHAGFKRDLRKAKGVICNAGFELISECLHLGLPVLAKPLTGQIEQQSNAIALSQLGYADILSELSLQVMKQWLDKDRAVQEHPIPDVAGPLVEWILSGQWDNSKPLMERLWQC